MATGGGAVHRGDGTKFDSSGRAIFGGLVAGLLQTESGFAGIDRLTAHRLRKAFGPRGKELITNGSGAEYRLAVPPEHIAVTPCFAELVGRMVVSAEEAELLQKRLRKVRIKDQFEAQPRRQKRKPRGNRKETRKKQK